MDAGDVNNCKSSESKVVVIGGQTRVAVAETR